MTIRDCGSCLAVLRKSQERAKVLVSIQKAHSAHYSTERRSEQLMKPEITLLINEAEKQNKMEFCSCVLYMCGCKYNIQISPLKFIRTVQISFMSLLEACWMLNNIAPLAIASLHPLHPIVIKCSQPCFYVSMENCIFHMYKICN